MFERISGPSFEERVADYRKKLWNMTAGAVVELAATVTGSPWDPPFAPIDPALNATATQVAKEAGLAEQIWLVQNA